MSARRTDNGGEMAPEHQILVEVAGPGVDPTTVAAREMLALASAYLDALVRIVRDEEDHALVLTGVRIINKCAAISVHADRPDYAAAAGALARQYLANPTDAPRGAKSEIARLATAIRELPPTYSPSARFRTAAGERVFRLEVVVPDVALPAYEVISIRAEPIRAGGNRPVARFEARGEGKPFTLEADDWDTIRKVGSSLHKPCDLVAKVCRDTDGNIVAGEILSVDIPDHESREAWERWYAANKDNVSFDADRGGTDE